MFVCYRQLMSGFVSTKFQLGSLKISLHSMEKQKIRQVQFVIDAAYNLPEDILTEH